jgi:1,4-alpha-glucan branching enzyme
VSLDWHLTGEPLHAGIRRLVADVNRTYRREPALYEVDFDGSGFSWIDCNDADSSVISFVRRARDPRDLLVVVLNWTPVVRYGYRIGVPEPGFYRELLNSDAGWYGGSNSGNEGGVWSEPVPAHGHAQSIVLSLPPLGGLWLKPIRSVPGAPPIPAPPPA